MKTMYKMNFPFKDPVRIAWKTFRSANNVLLSLDDGAHRGFGEASPSPVTKDTQRSVLYILRKANISAPAEVREEHVARVSSMRLSPTVRAAIDFALHDLWGKQQNKPVAKLYSPRTKSVPNCITIFGKRPKETGEAVGRVLKRFPHLKILKLKLMGTGDVERCEAVRQAAELSGRRISYVLDCNQAYKSADRAIAALSVFQDILGRVILVEEPVPARQWSMLKKVTADVDTLVFADESALGLDDARKIVDKGCADGINIKLQKTGGIYQAKRIADACAQNGLKCMVGCMFESSFGIAAGVHFAQSTKNVIVTDLDYDLQLPDIYRYRPGFAHGARFPVNSSGLGVALSPAKIRKAVKNGTLAFEEVK